jgi:hypothetical protein
LIGDIARPDTAGSNLVRDAAESMRLSARGFHRVLKLARTIPDLAGSPLVQHEDLAGGARYSLRGIPRAVKLARVSLIFPSGRFQPSISPEQRSYHPRTTTTAIAA